MKKPVLFVGLLSLAMSAPCAAQTSFTMIGSLFPAGARRGATTEVTIHAGGNGGANLYGAYKVLFEGEGVRAEIVPPEKGWPAKDEKNPWALPSVGEVKMRVTVAPDAPLGAREVRVASERQGISSAGLLVIGDEPEAVEAEPNNAPEQAQALALPVVVNGRFQQEEDVDAYKIKVEAGQEVVFTALCARLQDKIHDLQEHADPLIVVTDSAGREVARNDDYYRADSLLHHKFAQAGEYCVQIRDVSYKGNPHWVYRLTMTTRPYVTGVVPCAVRPGESAELRVTGFNLGGTQSVRLVAPPNARPGAWLASLPFPQGASNPVPLLVTDLPQAVAAKQAALPGGESKTVTAAQAKAAPAMAKGGLALPGAVSSALEAAGQIDRYTFRAKKDEAWGFEIMARRLDSQLDAEIKLRDNMGNALAANDDAFGKDSRLDWTAPADGEYTLEVRDLADMGGPTFFYNLSARRLRPDFSLKCDPDRAMIAPGNRTSWYVQVERKYGFAGPIRVEIKGLPPGVAVTPLVIPPNMTTGTLILSAAPDAKTDMALAEVVGAAELPGEDGKPMQAARIARPVTEIYIPGGGRGLLEVDTQGVAITDTNDLEVTADTQKVTLAPGGAAKIAVTLKRRPDYKKPVTLDVRVQHLGGIFVDPLPPGVSVDEGASKLLLNEDETQGHITLKAAPDAQAVTEVTLAVFANVSINFVMKVWYSALPISLTVAPAEKK